MVVVSYVLLGRKLVSCRKNLGVRCGKWSFLSLVEGPIAVAAANGGATDAESLGRDRYSLLGTDVCRKKWIWV